MMSSPEHALVTATVYAILTALGVHLPTLHLDSAMSLSLLCSKSTLQETKAEHGYVT